MKDIMLKRMHDAELTVRFETDIKWKKGDIIHIKTGLFEGDYKIVDIRPFSERGMDKINLKLERVLAEK